MGASAWTYYALYQEDIRGLLDELRKKEYLEKKDYYRARIEMFMGWLQEMSDDAFNDYLDSDDLIADFAPYGVPSREELIKWRIDLEPRSLDELIKLLRDQGASSIIDIPTVSEEPGTLQLFPMPEGRLLRFFSTTRPTRKVLQDKEARIRGFHLSSRARSESVGGVLPTLQ